MIFFLINIFTQFLKEGSSAVFAAIALGVCLPFSFVWTGIKLLSLNRSAYTLTHIMTWFGWLLWAGAAFAVLWEPPHPVTARILFVGGTTISIVLLCLIYSTEVRKAFDNNPKVFVPQKSDLTKWEM